MSTRLSDIRHSALFLAIENRQSKFENRHSATPTLVASTRKRSVFLRGHSSVGRAPALQAGSQGFESPCLHAFARVVEESEDCRAVALAEADIFSACSISRASYDSAIRFI